MPLTKIVISYVLSGKINRYLTYLATADHAFVLVVAERAFIADSDKSRRSNITITNRAFPITLIAETTYCYARLFAAHDQVAASKVITDPYKIDMG